MGRVALNISVAAAFIADPHSIDRVPTGRQIDWANVGNEYRTTPGLAIVNVTVASSAIATATSVSVNALSGPIPSGTTISLGTNKFMRLTADAAAGATSLTVAALPTALAGAETGVYAGTAGSGNKVIKAGTPVGDLLGSGKISPRIATTNPAIGLLETDAVEGDPSAAISGYGVISGGSIYVNMLPAVWLTGTPKVLITAVATELQTAGVGSFRWYQYSDAR